MATGLSDLISGLREAEDAYRQASSEAFAFVEPAICGMVEIAPMTPKMFIDLEGAENAFFGRKGTSITVGDVGAFLWRCSPHYAYGTDEAKAMRSFFNLNLYVVPYDQAVDDINAYIERTWAGEPLWKTSSRAERSLGNWASRLVHMMAKEYSWKEDYILNLPFRRLWQYANRIMESNDPDYKELCAASMRIRAEYLAMIQAGLDAEKLKEGGRN